MTSSMPSCARDGLGGRPAVAGEHDDAHAFASQRVERLGACVALIGSATPSSPRGAPSIADEMTVWPSRAQLLRAGRQRVRRRRRRSASARRCRARPSRPSTVPATPWPVTSVEILARRAARCRARCAPATIAAASGCSLACSRRPRAAATSASVERRRSAHDARRAAGLPSVSVPVLSTTSVSTVSQPLERLGVAEQHAERRAAAGRHHDRHRRREAERARTRDDQHRHRVDQRVREARLGPERSPDDERDDGDRDDGRHELRRRRDRPAAESARGCAALRRPCATICASSVSRADALGAHHETSRCR